MQSPALNKTSLIAALLTAGAVGGAGVGAYNRLHTPALAALAPVPSSAVTGMSLPDFPQITAHLNFYASTSKGCNTPAPSLGERSSLRPISRLGSCALSLNGISIVSARQPNCS